MKALAVVIALIALVGLYTLLASIHAYLRILIRVLPVPWQVGVSCQ